MKFEDYQISIVPLSEEDGGGYLASLLNIKGCLADGETPDEAIVELRDAFEAWKMAQLEDGKAMPDAKVWSGQYVQRLPKSLHRELALKASLEGVSINQLAATYIAQGLST